MEVQKTNNQPSFGMANSTGVERAVKIAVAGVTSAGDAFVCANTGATYPTVHAITSFDITDALISLKALVKRLFKPTVELPKRPRGNFNSTSN